MELRPTDRDTSIESDMGELCATQTISSEQGNGCAFALLLVVLTRELMQENELTRIPFPKSQQLHPKISILASISIYCCLTTVIPYPLSYLPYPTSSSSTPFARTPRPQSGVLEKAGLIDDATLCLHLPSFLPCLPTSHLAFTFDSVSVFVAGGVAFVMRSD